jgi:hypothetical protein
MSEPCKAVVEYKGKYTNHTLLQQLATKVQVHHHHRQNEAVHMNPDSEREDGSDPSAMTGGSNSTVGDDQPSVFSSGSPVHRTDLESNSLGNSVFYDDPDGNFSLVSTL